MAGMGRHQTHNVTRQGLRFSIFQVCIDDLSQFPGVAAIP